MSKPLKSHAAGLPEIEDQQGRKLDETRRVRICICKESRTNRKSNGVKVATSSKSKTHNRHWKTRPISVCECLIVIFKVTRNQVFDCDFFHM